MGETLFIGLSIASILLLIALGLAITYGSMGVINMAHGELAMIGAYTTVMATSHLGLPFLLCIPLAFLVSGAIGFGIERLIVRKLYGRLLDTLLATWGLAIVIQQAVRIEFGLALFNIHVHGLGPGLQHVPVPEWLVGIQKIGNFPIPIQMYRSLIILVTLVLFVLTWWLLFRTSFGIQLRAVTRNRSMATCCGIDDKKINAWTFALGSGLAGVAGVMISGFMTVSPYMGTRLVVEGFLVVVAGGVSSLTGSLATAAILGEVNSWVAKYSNDIYGRAIVFAVVILILIVRPQGLFTPKSR